MATSQLAAEALLAVTGVTPLLERAPRPITQAAGAAARRLPKRITGLLAEFLDGARFHEPERPEPTPLDYDELVTRIFEPEPDTAAIARLISGFEDVELAQAWLQAMRAGVVYLQSVIPRESRQTMLGLERIQPSDFDLAVFRRRWEVANDPLQAVCDLVAGPLVPDQIEALVAVYPQLYEAVQSATFQLLIERRAKDEEFTLPYSKQLVLETLFQASVLDPAFQRGLQEARNAEAKGKPKPAFSRLDVDASDAATSVQKIETR